MAAGLAVNDSDWLAFRSRFVASDGRIVDTGNGGISHSEGQGWGLFFAETFDDPRSFDLILDWTSRVLRRPTDSLHAWRYVPGAKPPVGDPNNATDGDLFIAFSLARGAKRWGRPDFARVATEIARDLIRLSVKDVKGRLILLPGTGGFATSTATVVNLSYYVLPALAELSNLVPDPKWERVKADGLDLVDKAQFGRWRLPPDWLQIDDATGALSPAPAWPPRFSFDAIRIPLYLTWGGQMPQTLSQSLTSLWSAHPGASGQMEAASRFPAWVDLKMDAVSPYPAPTGFHAVADLALRDPYRAAEVAWPTVATAPDYYSAALTLLAKVAAREAVPFPAADTLR